MPMHDWTRVEAGLFHHFHQRWISAICDLLNTGGLPKGYFALGEQVAGGPIPDVLSLRSSRAPSGEQVATLPPPQTRFVHQSEHAVYARKANRVVVRHKRGRIVSVVEIVSPGNKDSRNALRAFVEKSTSLLEQGVNLLIVDPFPPGPRDPHGIHKEIWDDIHEEPFELPADKPLTLVAYSAGAVKTAYVEPIAVGDALPDMPLFLDEERYVPCPLEKSYDQSWAVFPEELKPELDPALRPEPP